AAISATDTLTWREAWSAAARAGASTSPTANGYAPVVRWPSTAESAFHETVYTPSRSERMETVRWVGSSGLTRESPLSMTWPFESRTLTALYVGSSASLKNSSTW